MKSLGLCQNTIWWRNDRSWTIAFSAFSHIWEKQNMCLYNPWKSLNYDYYYPYNKDLGIEIGQYDRLKKIPSDLFIWSVYESWYSDNRLGLLVSCFLFSASSKGEILQNLRFAKDYWMMMLTKIVMYKKYN